jgi:hypothetical protein
MLRWLVVSLSLLTQASTGALVYDFEWRVLASVSRLEGEKTKTIRGEMQGRGRLTLRVEGEQLLAFDWQARNGKGNGLIGPNGPEHVSFPLPPEVGFPPAPPYRGVGTFDFDGERNSPAAFSISWIEAFYCRTALKACDNIVAWERSFEGVARTRASAFSSCDARRDEACTRSSRRALATTLR